MAGNAERAGAARHGRRHGATGLLVDPHDRIVGYGIELQVDDGQACENGMEPDPRDDLRSRQSSLSVRGQDAGRDAAAIVGKQSQTERDVADGERGHHDHAAREPRLGVHALHEPADKQLDDLGTDKQLDRRHREQRGNHADEEPPLRMPGQPTHVIGLLESPACGSARTDNEVVQTEPRE